MDDLVKNQNDQLRAQNNAPSWRDCNAAGYPHLWVRSHRVDGVTYWRCVRHSCSVGTRTEVDTVPNGVLH